MDKKLIVRLSNELGNQMFMYASSYAIAKKLNRLLLVDDESAFLTRKNISKYGLGEFEISSKIANKENKFLGSKGYLKRKILKKIDLFKSSKSFFVEPKDTNKITEFNDQIYNFKLSNNLYLEGYFESEKYFEDIKDNIHQEFTFLRREMYKKSMFFNILNNENSVSICLRQNRFIEGKNRNTEANRVKSEKFKKEQISYINKSIDYLKSMIKNPTFYLWSNDLKNIDITMFNSKVTKVTHKDEFLSKVDQRSLDLFLISQCNHHIVIPSSFNWWGAWLSQRIDKIICRPNEKFFSNFKLNNRDFWPVHWRVI